MSSDTELLQTMFEDVVHLPKMTSPYLTKTASPYLTKTSSLYHVEPHFNKTEKEKGKGLDSNTDEESKQHLVNSFN